MSQPAKKAKVSQLDQLKEMTTVVADSGDINSIKSYLPQDATTNPSLIYQAAAMPEYQSVVDDAVARGKASRKSGAALLDEVMDQLAVGFGVEILGVVPGRVSTEVDARLSFDTAGSVAKARKLIGLYEARGVKEARARVLIKLASTWEGVEAARILQKEGINCNMTLIFNYEQAIACAQAGAFLISPFVGRILDWHKKQRGADGAAFTAEDDPGVLSVAKIYNYYKRHGFATIVMGASFRNIGELQQLAGCDYLTIAPKLLQQLNDTYEPMPRRLDAAAAAGLDITQIAVDENTFRWAMNEDAMATEKLAEGIRNFAADLVRLESIIQKKLE